MRKNILLAGIMASSLMGMSSCKPISLTGCGSFYTLQLASQSVGINQRVPLLLAINNPCEHDLEYRFIAQRGQVLSQNPLMPSGEYLAPFTGGEDTIVASIYDRTDQTNLPQQTVRLLVLGDGMAFVEAPAPGTTLGDNDNGVIKVAGIQGVGGGLPARQVALGRQPAISPDGKYLAYTYYPGDGSSQIRIQDALGNVQIMTGSGGSFNRDPSWAPIGSDRNYHLVFSSDRLSDSTGQNLDQRGDQYNIWRVSALGQNLQQLASTPGSDSEPAWSPDGTTIVYRSNFSQNRVQNFSNLWRLELSSGRLLQLTYETVPDKGAFEPEFSPDGGRVVYSRKYISRQAQVLANLQKIWLITLSTIDIPNLLPLTPDGGTVNAPGTGNREANFGNLATQEFDDGAQELSPSFSVDGRFITYVRRQGEEVRALSIPGNPGLQGSSGFQPINVMPQGSERALEISWARQSRTFSR